MKNSHSTLPDRKLKEFAPTPNLPRSGVNQWLREFSGAASSSRLRDMLVNSAQDSMVVCDRYLNILFHNPAYRKLIGHQEGSFEGLSLLSFVPAAFRKDTDAAFRQLLHGSSTTMEVEVSLLQNTGKTTRVSGKISRTRRRDGEYFFYLVLRPMETVSVAEVAQPATGGLLLNNLPMMMWETNADLEITAAHGRLWSRFGLKPTSVVGSQLSDDFCLNTPDFMRGVDFSDLTKGDPVSAFVEWNGETLDLTVYPVTGKRYKLIGTVGYITIPNQVQNADDVEAYIKSRGVAVNIRKLVPPESVALAR